MAFSTTYTFTANTTISSSQVNQNNSDIETAINSIHSYIGNAVITNAMLAGSIDLTSKVTGLLPAANFVESGDVLLSTIAKTQSGWTEITSSYSGRYLRLGGTGLATGGAASHTHTGPSHTHTGPSHTHTVSRGPYSEATATTYIAIAGSGYARSISTDITSGAGGTGNTGAGGTGNTGSASNNPIYLDLRAYQKS